VLAQLRYSSGGHTRSPYRSPDGLVGRALSELVTWRRRRVQASRDDLRWRSVWACDARGEMRCLVCVCVCLGVFVWECVLGCVRGYEWGGEREARDTARPVRLLRAAAREGVVSRLAR
jgi:hypothetical protein